MDGKQQIISVLREKAVICVSTSHGEKIKSRMMHFAFTDDLKIYVSSVKYDPKIRQMTLNDSVSLLTHLEGGSFPEDREVEITGSARMIKDREAAEKAKKLLIERSPVVKSLVGAGQESLLVFIEITPEQVKYRKVGDILQGRPPVVIGESAKKSPIRTDLEKLAKKAAAWVEESRYPFLTASLLPAVLGAAAAFSSGANFNALNFFITLAGVAFMHLGANTINDYFDHVSGNDEKNLEYVRPFSGGARMIQAGLLSPLEVLSGALVFFLLGALAGLYLALAAGLPVLYIGLAGAAVGFLYVSPFMGIAKTGAGEIASGACLGTLVTLGSYYVQAGGFSPAVLWISLPAGILVGAILWINEFPDFRADKETGKTNLIVRLGRKKASEVFPFIMAAAYIALAAGIAAGQLPPKTAAAFISLPAAAAAVFYARRHFDSPFDMAPGNGYTILCFNMTVIALAAACLLGAGSMDIFLSFVLAGTAYAAWMFITINNQRKAFIKLKEIS